MSKLPSRAWVRASLLGWLVLEPGRKRRHTTAQRDLTRARDRDVHPRQHLVDRRDLRSKQLEEVRDRIALRRRQLAEHDQDGKPPMYTTRHRPRGHRAGGGVLKVGRVTSVAGHYTASPRDRSTADCRSKLEGLAAYHHAKWGDRLEYHVAITVDGAIIWNRPAALLAYGVGGSNTGTLHVVMLGTTGDRPTEAQQQTVEWLAVNWHTEAVPAQFRAPRDLRTVPWKGHKEYPPPGGLTACPGEFLTVYKSRGRNR